MINIEKDGINYQLDDKQFTAIIDKSPNATDDIFIPRSIQHNSKDYIITSLSEGSFFFNYNIKSITFSNDSAIDKIPPKVFAGCQI